MASNVSAQHQHSNHLGPQSSNADTSEPRSADPQSVVGHAEEVKQDAKSKLLEDLKAKPSHSDHLKAEQEAQQQEFSNFSFWRQPLAEIVDE